LSMSSDHNPLLMARPQFSSTSGADLALENFNPNGSVISPAVRDPALLDSPSAPFRVIIDTDPGYDDALALLFAMSSPELRIEAITAVAGNGPIEITLSNALRMVDAAGRTEVPVAGGPPTPMTRQLVSGTEFHGENGLAGAVFPTPTSKAVNMPAAELIQSVVRKYPGEVTLIPIGPHTNIATAILADPALAGMVRGIVMMGGAVSAGNTTPAAEFNIYVDPEAARIVFHSGIPITMVGLDVTDQVLLKEEHVRSLEAGQTRVSQAAAKIARAVVGWYRDKGYVSGPIMHDSLAIAALLAPQLLRLEDFYIDVETSGDVTAGQTVGYSPIHLNQKWLVPNSPHPGSRDPAYYRPPKIRGAAPSIYRPLDSVFFTNTYKPNAKVAMDVDVDGFFRLLIGRLSGMSTSTEERDATARSKGI
jgi:inosine-uridine nucleoside N-ribohydrolase